MRLAHAGRLLRERVGEWWDVLLVVALIVACYAGFWRTLDPLAASVAAGAPLFCDFRLHFYPTGATVLRTAAPVAGFFYPPFAAVFFAAFGLMAWPVAEVCWGLLQVVATLALILLPSGSVFLGRRPCRIACALLVMTSLPVLHNFKWGQVSVLLTVLSLLAIRLRDSGRMALPAALLGFAISIKLYPALLLPSWLLRRDYRFVASCLGFALVLSLGAPALFLGPEGAVQFARTVQKTAQEALDTWVWGDLNSQYVGHVLGRLLRSAALARATFWPPVGVAISAANLALFYRVVHMRLAHPSYWGFALGFGCVPFLLETSWPHYFAFLPVAQTFVGMAVFDAWRGSAMRSVAAAIALLVSVAASCLLALIWVAPWPILSGQGAFFFANLSMLVACWLVLGGPTGPERRGGTPRRREIPVSSLWSAGGSSAR